MKDNVEFHYVAVPTKCGVCGNIYQSMLMYDIDGRRICYICIKEVAKGGGEGSGALHLRP